MPPTTAATTTASTTPAPAQNQSGNGTIVIQNFAFAPAQVNVSVGTKMIVTNKDNFDHTWTSNNGVWDSGHISGGQSYTFTFAQPGTYAYHCAIHNYMVGTVNVS